MVNMRRREEEQVEFRNFLDRLSHAKDKEEFNQFMVQRKQRPTRRTTRRSKADLKQGCSREKLSLRRDAL